MAILSRRLLVRSLGTLALADFVGTHSLPVRAAAEVTETVTISTPSGNRVSAILALPSNIPAPAVVVIHGALGRSSWYIDLAKRFAEQGFVGLAIDLFNGNVTTDFNQADVLVAEAESHLDRTIQIIVTWLDWLRSDNRTTGKVGLFGYSFGTRMAIHAALAAPVDASVLCVDTDRGMYDVAKLTHFNGLVIGHYATKDQNVGSGSVESFVRRMKEADRPMQVNWYETGHRFMVPTAPDYSKTDAELAWQRTIDFLNSTLR
jgi:carboxymethylenebutenolidase